MDQPRRKNSSSRRAAQPPRVVLLDQHAILIDGLSALLHSEGRAQIVGKAKSLEEAEQVIAATSPDLVIMDIALRDESTIPLIAELKQSQTDVRVLVLSTSFSREMVQAALDAGADGYILKDATKSELLRAIRDLHAGKQFVSNEVATRVLSGLFGRGTRSRHDDPRPVLTSRERQILKMIALADSTKAIASKLNLSVKTVEKHRANLMKKLELKNAAAVTLFAVRHGMIPVETSSDEKRLRWQRTR